MDDPSALRSAPRVRRIFKFLFWGVVFPLAMVTLLGLAYMIFVLGIEHY